MNTSSCWREIGFIFYLYPASIRPEFVPEIASKRHIPRVLKEVLCQP
jgi:hypothetical protein